MSRLPRPPSAGELSQPPAIRTQMMKKRRGSLNEIQAFPHNRLAPLPAAPRRGSVDGRTGGAMDYGPKRATTPQIGVMSKGRYPSTATGKLKSKRSYIDIGRARRRIPNWYELNLFRRSVANGWIKEVKRMIEVHGLEMVDCKDNNGETPFMIACNVDVAHVGKLLVLKGCDTDTKNRKGLTAWDQAVSAGNLATFDTLKELAQCSKEEPEARFPKLTSEYNLQRFRRAECVSNQDPWQRFFNQIWDKKIASLPLWKLLLRAFFTQGRSLAEFREIVLALIAEECEDEAEEVVPLAESEEPKAMSEHERVLHVMDSLQDEAFNQRTEVETQRLHIAQSLSAGPDKGHAMMALRDLELECEAKEAEAASFKAYADEVKPKLSRIAAAVLEARLTRKMGLGGVELEEHMGGDFGRHLTSYSPRSLDVPGGAS